MEITDQTIQEENLSQVVSEENQAQEAPEGNLSQDESEENNGWVLPIYLLLLLQCSNFFCWLTIPRGYFGHLINIEILFLLYYIFVNRDEVKHIATETLSGIYVLSFSLLLFVSVIPCYIYHGQSLYDSIKAIWPFTFILFYFVFYKNNIAEEKLIKLLITIALIKFVILFVQQFTYPDFWFSAYSEGDIDNYGKSYKVEVRSGIYRYLLGIMYIFYFVGFYLTSKLFNSSNKAKYIVLLGLIFLGIYFEQFRYNMVCFLLCWLWMYYMNNKRDISYFQVLTVLFLLYLLYSNFDLLFGDLKDRTEDDLSDDYIRMLCYSFYLLEYWVGPITMLFGNGYPLGSSGYGQEIQYYQEEFTFFRVDIGIIGTINIYGIVFLLILMLFIYRIYKKWRFIDLPYRAFLIWLALMIPLYMPIHYSSDTNLFMAGLLYLIDKSIDRNKSQDMNPEVYEENC